jgi:hypothetical protein
MHRRGREPSAVRLERNQVRQREKRKCSFERTLLRILAQIGPRIAHAWISSTRKLMYIEPIERTVDRFADLMQRQGWHVAKRRMAFDPVYARERFALAHTSADDSLRLLAVELFDRCTMTWCDVASIVDAQHEGR